MRQSLPYELDQRPVAAVVIGSQLAFGSVGNNVTARLIERAGHRTICIPTVVYSNLPHYASLSGGALEDEWLGGILDDLLLRGVLLDASFVCVGYLAHPGQARIIASWFSEVRKVNPDIRLIVDPVMGDDDVGLYVDGEMPAGYIKHLFPMASLICPNHYELGLLVGTASEKTVVERARSLVTPSLHWVVVTSAAHIDTESPTIDTLLVTSGGHTFAKAPWVNTAAKGAGDYFLGSAIGSLLNGHTVEVAVTEAAATTAWALSGNDPDFSGRSAKI